jgi:NADH-ubiquinone oxidoreductase chain 2
MIFIPSNLIFLIVIVVSSLLSVSASTWLGAWLGLEINLMRAIPLLIGGGLSLVECTIKYFLVQALSSLLFLVSVLNLGLVGNILIFNLDTVLNILVGVALLIKLGGAPFFQWFPSVVSGLSWASGYLVITWQKLAPLILLGYIITLNWPYILVIILSRYVGRTGGLNHTSLRRLISYSSINHLAWIILALNFSYYYILLYFFIYCVTRGILVYILNYSGYYYISQLFYSGQGGLSQLVIFINWLSFGGLPPFIGFLPKWVIINLSVTAGFNFIIIAMVIFGLWSMYYYIRVSYVVFMMSGCRLLHTPTNYFTNWSILFISILTLISLLLAPLGLALY